jgi:O-antigen/teichoic acid export membrane protein
MDILVLGFVVSDSLIGIYQVAWTLASFLAIAGSSISSTLFPQVSSLGTRKNFDQIKHLLSEGLAFSGVFLIPGFFGALIIGEDILRIYRPGFTTGALVLVILIAARGVNMYGGQFVNILNGIDRPEVAFRINAVFVGVNLVLNIGLVVVMGWYGAAIATFVSSVVYLVMGYRSLIREVGSLDIPIREIMMELLSSLAMVGFVWIASQGLPNSHIVTIGLVLSGSVVYAVSLLVMSIKIRRKALSFI